MARLLLLLILLFPYHSTISDNNANKFLTFTTEIIDSNKSHVTVFVIGMIYSNNENIIEYFNYSKLNDQLGGDNVLFQSLYFNNIDFNIKNKYKLEFITNKIKHKINSLSPDYIILYNMNSDNFEDLYEFLNNQYPDHYFTVGFVEDNNIVLKLDLTDFEKFLNHIDYEYDNFYLLSFLKSNIFNLDEELNFDIINLTTLSELRNVLMELNKTEDGFVLVFNLLQHLFSEVQSKIIFKQDIIDEFNRYNNIVFVDISIENEYRIPEYFELEWNYKRLFELLDTFIISTYYDIVEEELLHFTLTSKLNVNLNHIYRHKLLTDYDLLSIDDIMIYFNKIN
jgi:hypothetical protein